MEIQQPLALVGTLVPPRHELNVSTYQMCILLLFNAHQTLSYQETADFHRVLEHNSVGETARQWTRQVWDARQCGFDIHHIQDLHLHTNIPLDELKRHLMSLYVNPKARILVKVGNEKEKTKEPQDEDLFQVNYSFECKLFRIKVCGTGMVVKWSAERVSWLMSVCPCVRSWWERARGCSSAVRLDLEAPVHQRGKPTGSRSSWVRMTDGTVSATQ